MTTPDLSTELPHRGVLAGVDHGTKRIGIAVSDAAQTFSMPVTTLEAKSAVHNMALLRKVRDDYRVRGWVVGLPYLKSGDEGPQAVLVRRFGDWLAEVTELPVAYWDERLTSHAAEVLLSSLGESPGGTKSRVDGLAAQLILQAYLRHRTIESSDAEPLP